MMAAFQEPAGETSSEVSRRSPADVEQTLIHVREALRGLQYGEISIVVQDGVVLQIERTERTRIRRRTSH